VTPEEIEAALSALDDPTTPPVLAEALGYTTSLGEKKKERKRKRGGQSAPSALCRAPVRQGSCLLDPKPSILRL
jgi:hypothetical protein